MPKKSTTTNVMKHLGTAGKKAFNEHKEDEVVYAGGVELPAGIESGIAQLVDCKFDKYKKGDQEGEYFFYARGVVKSPKVHNSIPVEGLSTSIGPEALCDTPNKSRKTLSDHIGWILNELQKLGVPTAELDADDMETAVQALKEAKPHFRFRTWKGDKQEIVKRAGKWFVTGGRKEQGPYKTKDAAKKANPFAEVEPRVNHQWAGEVNYENGEEVDEVEDNTEATEAEPEADEDDVPFGTALDMLADAADGEDENAIAEMTEKAEAVGISEEDIENADDWNAVAEMIRTAGGSEESESEEEETEEEESTEDKTEETFALDELGEKADDEDEEAINSLTEQAEAAGLDPDEYDSWAELATALQSDETEEEETEPPVKGGIAFYKPPKSKKIIECEVTAVALKTETCKLKSLSDNRIFNNVPFAKLLDEEE